MAHPIVYEPTAVLYSQLDAAEDHDDFELMQIIEDELRARELAEEYRDSRAQEYAARNPELPDPWWRFR